MKAEGDCRSALAGDTKCSLPRSLSSHFIPPSCHPSFPPLPSCLLPTPSPFCLSTYSNVDELLQWMLANLTGCTAFDENPALDMWLYIFPPYAYIQPQVDAPSLLQRGLPRALPSLEEVKVESVKEGTQYESGEFQTPPQLPQGGPV